MRLACFFVFFAGAALGQPVTVMGVDWCFSAPFWPTTVTISPARASLQASKRGDKITVALSVPFKSVNWLPAPFFYDKATLVRGVAVMSSERP